MRRDLGALREAIRISPRSMIPQISTHRFDELAARIAQLAQDAPEDLAQPMHDTLAGEADDLVTRVGERGGEYPDEIAADQDSMPAWR